MLVIGTRCAYDQLTGDTIPWSAMTIWKTKKDVINSTGHAKTAKTKDPNKTPAAPKRKTQPASAGPRTRRSSGAMTQKMKDYKQSLAPGASDGKDDKSNEIKVVNINDENVDPAGSLKINNGGVVVPNMLPIPAFIVAALMRTYASDAATLFLATINAIKERATRAGEDPFLSKNADRASYVAAWLWNVARREQSERLKCVQIGPVANPKADKWSRNCHLKHLAERPPSQHTIDTHSEVWTNLANALALQATDRAGPSAATATTKKQGFDAFPLTTQ